MKTAADPHQQVAKALIAERRRRDTKVREECISFAYVTELLRQFRNQQRGSPMRNRARHLDNTARRQLELVPERALHGERLPYAIVDIGSNSVRLVIYDGL